MATQEVAQFLVRLGVLDVLLPFLLVFTIMLGLLDRTRVLGSEKGRPKTKLNAMVAFVLAFISIVSLQEIIAIQTFGVVTSVSIIVALVLLMTVGLLGGKVPSKLLTWCGIAICAIGGFVILDRLNILPKNLSDIATMVWGPPFAIIVALFVVGWFIFRERPGETKASSSGATSAEKKGSSTESSSNENKPDHVELYPDKMKPKGPGGMLWEQ